MRKLFRRLSALLQRRRLERELEEEMAAHRDMLPPDRQRHFGSTLRLREQAADHWGWTFFDRLRQDLAYGARSLKRSPGFSLTAITVLSLGIGVNLAEVHIFKAIFQQLHVRNVDSLVRLSPITKSEIQGDLPTQAIDFYRQYNTVFSAVISESDRPGIFAENDSEDLRCAMVNGTYFNDLGVIPAYGRLLNEDDDQPGAQPVAVLGWDYWQAHFGGDPSIVLKSIRLNNRPVQVIGIASADFSGLLRNRTYMWMPQRQYPYLMGSAAWQVDRSTMIGMLKPGVTLEAAQSQFQSLVAALRREQPQLVTADERVKLDYFLATQGKKGEALMFLIACVVMVLLVLLSACANLGNMLLARGFARQREMEIRFAIGAGRWRLIRQLMTENLLLAILASLGALVFARFAARLMFWIIQAPSNLRIQTDWQVVLACAALGLIAVLSFGLAPAFQIVRRGARAGLSRKVLVSFQVAVSCVLLILSSFLTRGVERNFQTELAFDYRQMAVVNPQYPYGKFTSAQSRQAAADLRARLLQVPGVDAATITTIPPFLRSSLDRSGRQQLYTSQVDPTYFPMMSLSLRQGRLFGPVEPDAAVISESAARKLWPNDSPIGKTLVMRSQSRTVVGVVKDSGINMVNNPESVEVYTPIGDSDAMFSVLLVHAANPQDILPTLRAAATSGRNFAVVATLDSILAQHLDAIRKTLMIVASLGAVASLLAMLGIFGLLAFTVAQRTREIGVRMALGAAGRDVLRCVLSQYAVPLGIGGVVGVLLAAIFAQGIRALFFGFVPLDAVSYAGGLVAFVLVAAAAAVIPARRALQIDPSSALRHE